MTLVNANAGFSAKLSRKNPGPSLLSWSESDAHPVVPSSPGSWSAGSIETKLCSATIRPSSDRSNAIDGAAVVSRSTSVSWIRPANMRKALTESRSVELATRSR